MAFALSCLALRRICAVGADDALSSHEAGFEALSSRRRGTGGQALGRW